MTENSLKACNTFLQSKYKITGIPTKRPALATINGNAGPRKSHNSSKFKCVPQPAPPEVFIVPDFHIFEDDDVKMDENKDKIVCRENKEKFRDNTKDKENGCSFVSEVSTVGFPSSAIEHFDLLDVNKVTESPKSNYDDDIEKEENEIENSWRAPYREDIYLYFKKIENNFRPNANYMEKQIDITMTMRSVLVDWLVEVAEEYKLHNQTVYLAVSYVDRFLSHMYVVKRKLQLVGTASMFIAAKLEEIYPPELKDFVYVTADTYTKQQILKMEHLILKVLNFDISIPTIHYFLQLFCTMCHVSETVTNLSQYLCEITLLDDVPFLEFSPSLVAVASIALANYTLGLDMWNETLEEISGYRLEALYLIVINMYEKYAAMPSCPQQAIREKYKSPKYGCVATIQHPKEVIFPDAVVFAVPVPE